MLEFDSEYARKRTEEFIDKDFNFQKSEIYKCIDHAINIGESAITIYCFVKKNVLEFFKDKGYKIEDKYNQKDGYLYVISW